MRSSADADKPAPRV